MIRLYSSMTYLFFEDDVHSFFYLQNDQKAMWVSNIAKKNRNIWENRDASLKMKDPERQASPEVLLHGQLISVPCCPMVKSRTCSTVMYKKLWCMQWEHHGNMMEKILRYNQL